MGIDVVGESFAQVMSDGPKRGCLDSTNNVN